jgi:hypothetical protein
MLFRWQGHNVFNGGWRGCSEAGKEDEDPKASRKFIIGFDST